jgi:hypothetical protein
VFSLLCHSRFGRAALRRGRAQKWLHRPGQSRTLPACRYTLSLAALFLLLALPSSAQESSTNTPAPARKPGEIRWHSDRYLNGEILPGDKIVWHTGEYRDRNVGIACADGEDGLYLEDFGVRVKDVVFTEMPRPGDDDWTAVNAAHAEIEELRRRAADIERIAFHLGDTSSSNRTRVIDFLRELADLERPGLYVSPYTDSGAYIEESRAELLARIARREREARGFCQCDFSRLRGRILRKVAVTADIPNRRPFGGNGPDPLPAAFAAEAGITRYERTCAEQETTLRGILYERDFSSWTLVPRRLPEAAPVPTLPPDAASRLDALAAAAHEATDGPWLHPFGEPPAALSAFAVEAAWQTELLLAGTDRTARKKRLTSIARLLAATLPAEELPQFARRAIVSFPHAPDAWRFAAELCSVLLAAHPTAASGSTDWSETAPRTESDCLDLAARRAVVPIRTFFRADAFRDLCRTLPPEAAEAFLADISTRLGASPSLSASPDPLAQSAASRVFQ